MSILNTPTIDLTEVELNVHLLVQQLEAEEAHAIAVDGLKSIRTILASDTPSGEFFSMIKTQLEVINVSTESTSLAIKDIDLILASVSNEGSVKNFFNGLVIGTILLILVTGLASIPVGMVGFITAIEPILTTFVLQYLVIFPLLTTILTLEEGRVPSSTVTGLSGKDMKDAYGKLISSLDAIINIEKVDAKVLSSIKKTLTSNGLYFDGKKATPKSTIKLAKINISKTWSFDDLAEVGKIVKDCHIYIDKVRESEEALAKVVKSKSVDDTVSDTDKLLAMEYLSIVKSTGRLIITDLTLLNKTYTSIAKTFISVNK